MMSGLSRDRKKIIEKLHFYWPDADFALEKGENGKALLESRTEIETIAKKCLHYDNPPERLQKNLLIAVIKLTKVYLDCGLPEATANRRAALSYKVIDRAVACAMKEIEDERKVRAEKRAKKEAPADEFGEREEDPKEYIAEPLIIRARYDIGFSRN